MTNEATNSDVEKLIESEIADFFAGIGHPGEPETPQEMQQQLQSRISAIFNSAPNGMMQLSNELAEMKRSKLAVKLPDWWANEYMEKCLYYKDVVECIEEYGITVEKGGE
ncbi:hypothetical protein GJV07_21995 [Enterobacteriaceae bacterium RIT711]|nr:hypothetical protein [Enterobacteriaceae bacterium RIT711]